MGQDSIDPMCCSCRAFGGGIPDGREDFDRARDAYQRNGDAARSLAAE